jgi:hypothetical protein
LFDPFDFSNLVRVILSATSQYRNDDPQLKPAWLKVLDDKSSAWRLLLNYKYMGAYLASSRRINSTPAFSAD